jgi:aminoglycoside phosphotransferase (APT) family kinase protein
LLTRLERWLAAWAQMTCRSLPADRARLEREILTPAARLAPLLARGESYVSWLRNQCEALLGTPLPGVATHGDLSMSNVLIANAAPLGIIDWDEAREDGLPLMDFFYASADAVAAASRYRDRVRAFADCCDPETAAGAFVTAASRRLGGSLGLSAQATALLRHATALHHAGNEQVQDGAAGRPFLAMVQILADSIVTPTAVRG